MTQRPPAAIKRHALGAIAGVGPAAAIVGYYLATGGTFEPGLGIFVVYTVVAGWLVGPLASGPLRADLLAAGAYFLVAYLLNLVVGIVVAVWTEASAIHPRDLFSVLASAAPTLIGGLIYLPVWAVFLSPAVLLWIVIVRLLRGRGLASS